MSEQQTHVGVIDRLEPEERGKSLVVLKNEDETSEFEGKRFRAWRTEYGSDEVSDLWKQVEAFKLGGEPVAITYHVETFNGAKGPIKTNVIDEIQLSNGAAPVEGNGSVAPGASIDNVIAALEDALRAAYSVKGHQ